MSSSRSESRIQYSCDCSRNLVCKNNHDTDSSQEVQQSHSRNYLCSNSCDGFQTADGYSSNNNSQSNAGVNNRNTGRNLGNFNNGVYLSKGTDTKVCAQNTEYGKHNSQRFVFFAKTIFNVVHRTTGNIAVSIDSTIFYSQQTFGIFGCHTEEGCHPHPEQSARATCFNCSCNTNDVTGTNSCSKCGTQCFKAVYVTTAIVLGTEDQAQSLRQLENLQQLQTEGQQNTGTNQKYQKRRTPDKRINFIQNFQHDSNISL